MTELIDIGVNLTHDSFDADRPDVLRRAADAGITRLIVTGTSVTSSVQAIALADAQPDALFATAGIHPHNAGDFDEHSLSALRALLAHEQVVAVGECGLDYYREFSPREVQHSAFAAQLALAGEMRLPVFLHQRDAHQPFIELVAAARDAFPGGVAHCFTGGLAELRAYLDLDLHIGVTGWVCDERRGKALRSVLPDVPLERLLIETDAPYLLPRDLRPIPRGRRNEPQFLLHVLQRIAEEMNKPIEQIARATRENAERLFGLPPRSQHRLI
jgi:TatD DNase family protein